MKKRTGMEIFAGGALDIEFGRDWSFRRRSHRKINFFQFQGFFWKSQKCHIVGFRMHSKLTKFDEIRWSHF